MAAKPNVKLKFHVSKIDDPQNETIAEKTGMISLALDFIGDKSLGKANKLKKISQAYIPFHLAKTKAGGYLGINPNSTKAIRVPLAQLVEESDLRTFLEDEGNLEINRVMKKLTTMELDEKNLSGGMKGENLETLKVLLTFPQATGQDRIKQLPTLLPLANIKEELKDINTSLYDDTRLKTEIDKRIAMAETAFKNHLASKKDELKERETFWKTELKRLETEEKTALKERETLYKKDIKNLESEIAKKKKANISVLKKGLVKNMNKESKEIADMVAKFQSELQAIDSENPYDALLKGLEDIKEEGNTFMAAVDFAMRNVHETRSKEGDIDFDASVEREKIDKKYNEDKEKILIGRSEKIAQSESELAELTHKVKLAQQKLDQFNKEKKNWASMISKAVVTDSSIMIGEDAVPVEGNLVDLLVPVYIFQYEDNRGNIATKIVPPVRLPENLSKVKSKSVITGKKKAITYILPHPGLVKITDELVKLLEQNLEIRQSIDDLPNIIGDKTEIFNMFQSAKDLFIGTLKMKDKNFENIFKNASSLLL